MQFSMKKLENEPIILIDIHGHFDEEDGHDHAHDHFNEAFMHMIMSTPERDIVIMDMSDYHPNFSELVQLLAHMRDDIREMGGPKIVDREMQYIVVGTDELVRLGVNAMSQRQYGGMRILLFSTLDIALTYAREELERQFA